MPAQTLRVCNSNRTGASTLSPAVLQKWYQHVLCTSVEGTVYCCPVLAQQVSFEQTVQTLPIFFSVSVAVYLGDSVVTRTSTGLAKLMAAASVTVLHAYAVSWPVITNR